MWHRTVNDPLKVRGTGRAPGQADARLDLRTILTGVVVPIAVGLMATQVDPRRGAVLAVIALGAMVIGLVPQLLTRTRRWHAKRADARLARELMPTIKDLFNRFGNFTYADRGNTLHYVLTSELREARAIVDSLRVADQQLFHCWWNALNRRVQLSRTSIVEAMAAVDELHTLINAYKRGCFDPVFDRANGEFLSSLTPRVASELESVREAFNGYLSRFEEVTDRISSQTTTVQPQRFFIDRPKPLRAVLAPAVVR